MAQPSGFSIADGFGGAGHRYHSSITVTGKDRIVSSLVRKKLNRGEFSTINKLIDNVPTPTSPEQLEELYGSVFMMGALDQLLVDEALNYGMPFSFKFEQSGATVQNIFPIKSHEEDQISSSSSTRLQMHTETAFHPRRPDFVLLYCLRADANAGTTLAHIADIVKRLPKTTIAVLQQPLFQVTPDLSFTKSGADSTPSQIAILNKLVTEIVYDEETMTPLTPEAEEAFAQLQRAIEASLKTVVLEQSEMMVIPNAQYIHGRTPFTARYDGTDRWLKRIMLRSFDKARQSNDGMAPIE